MLMICVCVVLVLGLKVDHVLQEPVYTR